MIKIPLKIKKNVEKSKLIKSDSQNLTNISGGRNLVDTNLSVSSKLNQGVIYLKLSSILNKIKSSVTVKLNSSGLADLEIKNFSKKVIKITLPVTNFDRLFEQNSFNNNFFISFKQTFPVNVTSTVLNNITLNIQNDLPFNNNSTLTSLEITSFRMLTCLIFGFRFGLVIGNGLCSCYPTNVAELNAVTSGIGMNCVKLECKNFLLLNPDLFDNLLNTDCSDIGIQAAFISISAFANGKISFDNLNVEQTFDCISQNSDVIVNSSV